MLRIIICDDDPIMLEKMSSIVETVFSNYETKVKIHAYLDALQISEPMLSSCDVALLDIDYENQSCNGMDIARQLRKVRNETFKIQVNGEIIDLAVKETVYLEVQQHNVTAYIQRDTSGKTLKPYSFYASLSHLEERLSPLGFLRIHKSYLVNMRYIKKFQCRQAELENGQILRVGEKSYAEKKKEYLLWKGWQ